ncbi:MAG: UDP-N-acetylglucosamine 2-epimerase (non-hydrolyzing) [Gammaproteobacteria bacterium]|nr:UDP-N-acetylglucosamine 2-epimerase (non-hydrolyzing) [Gammaproteobacteria bacterium]MCH9764001.1 UDP-N-acetylglucosamine 2-epimerase (non-hydrolyzing) [Gammaproteobacteria bacterium]
MKICTIVGARPQFVKAAVVSRAILARAGIDEVIIHTGQHYDSNMSSQFFDELDIPEPAYHLNIGSGAHGQQTGQMLEHIEKVLLQEKPDWVLVYGDTNSTLAGALAAAKLHIPVAHVEAGVRSFNRKMPEEINRITTDHISDRLFVPTKTAEQQLLKEGLDPAQVIYVGDVMYDATLYYNERNTSRDTLLDSLNLISKQYTLITLHRAENTDDSNRMQHIVSALLELSQQHALVLPLHPRTRAVLKKLNLFDSLEKNMMLLEPIGFLDMLALEQHAACIITDSGGVQKEAYFNRVPCITLRDETEWVELIEAGWNQLCSPSESFSLLNHPFFDTLPPTSSESLYGDGDASNKILDALIN